MREIIFKVSDRQMGFYWRMAVRELLVILLIMTVVSAGVLAVDCCEKVQLCQGNYLSEEQGKQQLAELADSYSNLNQWKARAQKIRAGILRGMQLEPLPAKSPLKPIIHSKRVYDGYTVENVAFESVPGFFVTGNLYRPENAVGTLPGVLCPHGHFYEPNGGGRFRNDMQLRCAALARMGAIVFSYDMVGWGESRQFENYTFPDSHKNCRFGLCLQTYNSIRAVDFLTLLDKVDRKRIGVTGASGGGTQAFLLAAVDDRIAVSVPVVMVSSYFFGGCNCESGMPIHISSAHKTNNAEISALSAPRPQLIISDGKDWTKNTPNVEFPYIKNVYKFYNAEGLVENVHLPSEGHDYGRSKRQPMYKFLAKHLSLSLDSLRLADGLVDESVVTIEKPEQMYVFDEEHPIPSHALKTSEEAFKTLKSLQKIPPGPVPGVSIDYIDSATKDYVGSPSIAILPGGSYVASHDTFGDGPKAGAGSFTSIFGSADSGQSWQILTELEGQWWSTLFVHRGDLYIIGTSRKHGDIVIRRSNNGGKSWTMPKDGNCGLLVKGRFHCAPVPVLEHKGRLWRGFESDLGRGRWQAFVMNPDVDADLLKAENWRMSEKLLNDRKAGIAKWLEGNVVATPGGGLVNILRTQKPANRAAMIHISDDGADLDFDTEKDMLDFPGGSKKFTIHFDDSTGDYWTLSNIITDPGTFVEPPQDHRNTLALMSSKDLRNWKICYIALSFMRGCYLTRANNKFGFQYVDWHFEGDDIIFVSRTAWGWDTPRSHDANYLTFYRICDFREKTLEDEPLNTDPYACCFRRYIR